MLFRKLSMGKISPISGINDVTLCSLTFHVFYEEAHTSKRRKIKGTGEEGKKTRKKIRQHFVTRKTIERKTYKNMINIYLNILELIKFSHAYIINDNFILLYYFQLS